MTSAHEPQRPHAWEEAPRKPVFRRILPPRFPQCLCNHICQTCYACVCFIQTEPLRKKLIRQTPFTARTSHALSYPEGSPGNLGKVLTLERWSFSASSEVPTSHA